MTRAIEKSKVNLTKAIRLARINETLENYALTNRESAVKVKKDDKVLDRIYNEESFWRDFFRDPERYWNKYFLIPKCILSFWVPRIPGLFYTRSGRLMREQGLEHKAKPEKQFKVRSELKPLGKSGVVLGGIGTFLFPPDLSGNQLTTLSLTYNASSGIPALISKSAFENLDLKEGDLLHIKKAKWCKMSTEWAQRFPSLREIKRGYFFIDQAEDVEVLKQDFPIQIHPCSIMEYETGEGILYDYVFVTVNSAEKKHRDLAIDFFEYYRTKENRNGKYLIAADIADPLFDSKYTSPESLANDLPGLNLIKHRINGLLIGEITIDEMISLLLIRFSSLSEIKAMCMHLSLPKRMPSASKPSDAIIEIVEYCIEHKKADELVDFLALNN